MSEGDEEIRGDPPAPEAETQHQLRGSSLLLVGRVAALAINFAVQVLIVRYLAKEDYGAFAYGLSVVMLGETVVTFGLDRGVTRFLPIFEETGRHRQMLGTLLFAVATVAGLSLAGLVLVIGLGSSFLGALAEQPGARLVVTILLVLAPIQALDQIVVGVFSGFKKTRIIFFRRYILGPGLRLLAVLSLVVTSSSGPFLAVAYVVAAAFALATYGPPLIRALREHRVLALDEPSPVDFPIKEILAFTAPLFSSDLVQAVLGSVDGVLLGNYAGAEDVAALRAIQPVARLNQLVLMSFGLLFVPLAARYFARKDAEAVHSLYWQTGAWVAVLSFPIFAVTSVLAEPLSVLFFGEEYRESGLLLAILAFGYFLHSALGFNGMTLTVYGRVWHIMVTNLMVIGVSLSAHLIFIPEYGALAAAAVTSGGLILHNLLRQWLLFRLTDVRAFDPATVRVYGVIAASMVVLSLAGLLALPIAILISLILLGSGLVLAVARSDLKPETVFPELTRLPVVGRIFRR